MNTGYATIITQIATGEHAEALKHFLRTDIEPLFDPDEPREILKCRPRFPFDRIASLHFCSFAVLDRDPDFPPCLVFEATFDGSVDRFLDALLEVAPGAIDEIYRHCRGYPASGCATPELVKKYLARHDKGADTFYFGSPGRTVAQIKGEAQVRDALADSVCQPWSRHKAMPATFTGILQELADVIRNTPGHRRVQRTAAAPWEVAWRKAVPIAAVLTALVVACSLGALVVESLCPPQAEIRVDTHDCGFLQFTWVLTSSLTLVEDSANFLPLFLLIALWAGLRFIYFVLQSLFKDPRRQSFWLRVSFHALIILRYFLIVVFILNAIPSIVSSDIWAPELSQAIAILIGAGLVFLLFQYLAISLKLSVQYKELEPAQKIRRSWLVDTLRVGMVVVAALAVLFLTRSLSRAQTGIAPGIVIDALVQLKSFVRALAFFAVVGLIVVYVIACLLFVRLRIKESCDANRFSDAEGLAAYDDSSAYAREEGGINTYQNHLISLTYVKPGRLRAVSLWLTLLVVGLLSRFWYNKGELGGIPTILSARWVLIDGGRRLLFLDHYSGAWNSYLNEFIDMTAVFGLNAIWTNTFIKVGELQYGFPETEYYLWKGAQVARPFKAYVRHSQIETIVWYSAYPTVSTVNVNTNTEVTQSLFKPPVSFEIDSLLQNL
jgi:hypothetical protein